MKDNQFSTTDQATDLECVQDSQGYNGGSASAPLTPPTGGGDRNDSLLYHSENNSDKQYSEKSLKLTNEQAKTFFCLEKNTKHFIKIYGAEHVGILTLTFKENLQDSKESQRRWNNLNRMINREKKFQVLVKVIEPQKRGAIHYHLIVRTFEPIRGKIDWGIYEEMGKASCTKEKRRLGKELAKTAEPHLVELWGWLRRKCKSTGFGRSELMPLKKPHHIKNYIGKYLEKDLNDNSLKKGGKNQGMRMITYGRKAPKVASKKFSWNSGTGALYRLRLKYWAEARGIKDEEEMAELFGPRWSYVIYKQVMEDHALDIYLQQDYMARHEPENHKRTAVYPWKNKIVSGAFTQGCKERIMERYLTDDEQKRSSFQKHKEHYQKTLRAKKHAEFNAKVYG